MVNGMVPESTSNKCSGFAAACNPLIPGSNPDGPTKFRAYVFWPTLGIISRLNFANAGLSLCTAAATTRADKTNAAVMRLTGSKFSGALHLVQGPRTSTRTKSGSYIDSDSNLDA